MWLVGFLELSRSKMEGYQKPSIAIQKTQHVHYGSGQTPPKTLKRSRGLGRPLLAKSKGAESFLEGSQAGPEGPSGCQRGVPGQVARMGGLWNLPARWLQAPSTGRLYPPSPFCGDAGSVTSVEASSAHVNGQRRSQQFRV